MSDQGMLLEGIRVIDLGSFVAGPAAATVMADFGADVIKIEPPGIGDTYRYLRDMPPMPKCDENYCWLLDGRGKRSLALDLKHGDARKILEKLVAGADVFLTNLPPAVRERLKITYSDLSGLNSRLIYASLTGYGERGEEASKPGYDATAYWARSGLMDVVRPQGGERGLSTPGMGDHPTSMSVFGAIMAGLYRRERTGKGCHVGSSLIANGIWANSIYIQSVLCGGDAFEPISRTDSPNALVGQYVCADDRAFLLALVQEEKDWPRFAKSIGREDLLADPRFSEMKERRKNASALIEILDEVFGAAPYSKWRTALADNNITFSPVNKLIDIPNDEQMIANDLFVEFDDPSLHGMRTVDSPIWIEGETKARPRTAPDIGEHTDEILRDLGYADETIADLKSKGAVTD